VEYIAERRLAVAYTSFFYVLIYLLPVVVMLVAYGRVVVTLARRRPIGDSPDSRRQSRQRLQVLQRHTPSHLTGVESYTVIYAANSYTYYYRFSIAHSLFHSRLKTFLFCKSFPLQPFFFFFRTDYMIPQTFTVTSEHIRFYFLIFLFYTFSCCFRAVD